MKEITLPAMVEKLEDVLAFLSQTLDELECGPRPAMQLAIAVEEIFVNIASYAYAGRVGFANLTIDRAEFRGEPAIKIVFRDNGVAYDPLKKPDPDITLGANERQIGGLGIFMVKKSMDEIGYERKNGWNELTLIKKI